MRFFALDCWNGSPAQAQSFITNTGISYPLLRTAGTVTGSYAGGYEYVYVIGGDGKVAYRNLSGWNTHEVDTAVQDALDVLAATPAPPRIQSRLELRTPFPNPFNPRTSIEIRSSDGRATLVSLSVHDLRGRQVRRLLDRVSVDISGRSVLWDGKDDAGRAVPSGVYLFRMTTPDAVQSTRGVLVR